MFGDQLSSRPLARNEQEESLDPPSASRHPGCRHPRAESQSLTCLFSTGLGRSEEHTSELQSQSNLVCRLLLEKKKKKEHSHATKTINNLTTLHTAVVHR